MRLDHNAETYQEIKQYFHERSIQMALDRFELKEVKDRGEVVTALFEKNGKEYHSIYIPRSQRGRGLYLKYAQDILPLEYGRVNIVTSYDCGIVNFLKSKGIEHTISLKWQDYAEYKIISNFYGTETAKRSGVPLMNHIDEGLVILHWMGASDAAKKAYCLHPIYQSDDLLKEFGVKDMRSKDMAGIFGISSDVITNAVEYRWVANNYLSTKISPWWKFWDNDYLNMEDIKLSPLKDVNDMLIADKIQNRKDFEIYHKGKHKRSRELDIYFKKWLQALGISESTYQDYKQRLSNGN